MATIPIANPISLELEELKTTRPQDLFPQLLKAFGDEPDCLGIVVVDMRSVPEYISLRKTLLSYSSYLAALPSDELERLENPHAKYVVGWSHGKEKLKSGAVDIRKGSSRTLPKSNQPQGVTMSIQRMTLLELLTRSNRSSQNTLTQISGPQKVCFQDFVTRFRSWENL